MPGILLEHLNRKFGVPEPEAAALLDFFQPVQLKKGAHLLEVGQICMFSAFVEAGALVYYQLADGREHACDFAFEQSWVSQIKSFNYQIPSEVGIKAIEPVRLQRISRDRMQELLARHPQYHAIRGAIAEELFLEMNERNLSHGTLSAEERYLRLMRTRPDVIRRAPQHYIATYLGILPESLSRIRKRIQ